MTAKICLILPAALLGLSLAGCASTVRSDASPAALDSPFRGATVLGSDSAGLSSRYAREKFIDTCLAGIRERTTTPDPLDPNPAAAAIKPPSP